MWILSFFFAAWVGVSWAASAPVLLIGSLGAVASPTAKWWVLAAVMAMWILPICIAFFGLFLWLNTRLPWLALIPVLIAVSTTGLGWYVWHLR